MPTVVHAPCDPSYYQGAHWNDTSRGVTTWDLNNEHTVTPILMPRTLPNNSATVIFTCTVPKCYLAYGTIAQCPSLNFFGQDACNVVFNAWRTGSGTVTSSIPLTYILNGTIIGGCFLSGVATHGATQAFDLANVNVRNCNATIYNDMGRNTLIIRNDSTSTIQLDHVKIYRTYKMCNPHADEGNMCTFDVGEGPCYSGTATGTSGSFDATRIDTPCNCTVGGGLSYTHWQDKSKQGHTLQPGETFSWTFDFSSLTPGNYMGKSLCLFNFNQIWPKTRARGDVTLEAQLNGTLINTYYLSRYANQGLFPSHDLAKCPGTLYNDVGRNIVSLINKSSTVAVQMSDDGIDIYRIFRASTIECCEGCQTCQTCQEACEICETCQAGCEICQTCYICQPCVACYSCYASCQESCQLSCQTCYTICQSACEAACQACEAGCQQGEGGCEPYCYACQSCMTRQSSQS